MRRRARRILPPYYAALLLSIAVIVLYNGLASRLGLGQRIDEAALEPGSVISHLLLVHNVSFDWVFRINGPLWSVATEWQIYWLFPGVAADVTSWATPDRRPAYAAGSLPFYLLSSEKSLGLSMVHRPSRSGCGGGDGFSPRSRLVDSVASAVGALTLAFLGVVATAPASTPASATHSATSSSACSRSLASTRDALGRAGAEEYDARSWARSRLFTSADSRTACTPAASVDPIHGEIFGRLAFGYDAIVAHLALATPFVMAAAWLFADLFEKPFTTGSIASGASTSSGSRQRRERAPPLPPTPML